MKKPVLFIIDDDEDMTEFIAVAAEQNGFFVEKFSDAALFKKDYKNNANVIILDLIMPDVDGIEIIGYLANLQSNARIILISGFDSGVLQTAQMLATEHQLNIEGILNKPFQVKELNALLQHLFVQLEK